MNGSNRRFEYLDWLRGAAAVVVLTYHARLLFFQDWGAGFNRGGGAQLFYFATGFGHLAVVVFFVLSGCVIAHVVLPRLEEDRWSWREYLIARSARFWAVLIPGLLLTLFWDRLAWALFPRSLTHATGRFANLLAPSDVEHLGLGDFLGNLFSLQTILVPCYGSNGALWSLASEFWYYLFFPALALVFIRTRISWLARITGALAALAGLWAIGGETARLFPVWLTGVFSYLAARRFPVQNTQSRNLGTMLSILAAAWVLSFIRLRATSHAMPEADYVAGAFVGGVIFFLIGQEPQFGATVAKSLHGVAGFSFTLYVAHTPVLAFLASYAMNGRAERWTLAPKYIAAYGAVVGGVLFYAWMIAAISESKTDRLRAMLQKVAGLDPALSISKGRSPGVRPSS